MKATKCKWYCMQQGGVKVWRCYLPGCSSKFNDGWAVFLFDSRGYFSVISDYGNYSHLWSSFGDDFPRFLVGVSAGHVLCKFARPVMERGVDVDKTAKGIKKHILQERRLGNLSREEARNEWNLVDDHLLDEGCGDCGFWAWSVETSFDDTHEFAVSKRDEEAIAFMKKVWFRFRDALVEFLASERTAYDVGLPKWEGFDTERWIRGFAEQSYEDCMGSCVEDGSCMTMILQAAVSACDMSHRLVELERLLHAPMCWQDNGEAGDGQSVCCGCGQDTEDAHTPHTWKQCADNIALTRDGLFGQLAELETEVCQLRAWKAGATGAATIMHPVRTGPHTEQAYCAHRSAYETAEESYRTRADVVSAAGLATKGKLELLVAELEAELAATNRELERWRHGVMVEGDYVCPDSLRRTKLEGVIREQADAAFAASNLGSVFANGALRDIWQALNSALEQDDGKS